MARLLPICSWLRLFRVLSFQSRRPTLVDFLWRFFILYVRGVPFDCFQCSQTCGSTGVSRRSVVCVDDHNRVVPDHLCVGEAKESTERECNRFPCPRWVYGHWSEVLFLINSCCGFCFMYLNSALFVLFDFHALVLSFLRWWCTYATCTVYGCCRQGDPSLTLWAEGDFVNLFCLRTNSLLELA